MTYLEKMLYMVCTEETGHTIEVKNHELVDQRVYKCFTQAYQVVEVCGSASEDLGSCITLLASPISTDGKTLTVIVDDSGNFHAADYIYGEPKRCFSNLEQAKKEVGRIARLIQENSPTAVVVA